MLKTINLTIPDNESVPEIIATFSPEENYLMLKIGSECLREGRNAAIGLSQKEIYQKIKDETKDDVQKLELDIIVQKEITKKMEEKISRMYEGQIEKLEKHIDLLSIQLKEHKFGSNEVIEKEVRKEREKYDLLLQEKDKQVDKMSENYEKMLAQSYKSTSHKGSDGEKTFSEYTQTFIDFKGFELIDKHTQGGEGDFHLHFEEFNVLADAKNYKKKVPIDQREKIKKDLKKNEHITFAWLVSLNTSIDKYDKSPIMYEWISTTQCIVYINNLSSFEDPKKILRIVWFTCKELYKLTKDDVQEDDLNELKERNYKLMDKIKSVRKTIREINTSMNTTRNLIQVMDDELRGILEAETNSIVTSNISLFDDWWEQNIEVTNDETIVSSSVLWIDFKQENKIMINEMNITGDKFKNYLKSKVPLSSIKLRNKSVNAAFDIKGICLKFLKNKEVEDEKIELELDESNLVSKKNKAVKKIKKEIYFDEITDKKIIKEYNNKDIMEVSEICNIRPWEVVSVLMKHQIIDKRDKAKGYDKYKETAEYKSKCKNNN
jgi:hypothetical protein